MSGGLHGRVVEALGHEISAGVHPPGAVLRTEELEQRFGISRSVAREVLSKCRIVAGLGIVENAYDKTAKIKAVGSHEFEDREKELLAERAVAEERTGGRRGLDRAGGGKRSRYEGHRPVFQAVRLSLATGSTLN